MVETITGNKSHFEIRHFKIFKEKVVTLFISDGRHLYTLIS